MKSIQLIIYTILILSVLVLVAQSEGLPVFKSFNLKYKCSTPETLNLGECGLLCDQWTKVIALPNTTVNNRLAFQVQYYTNDTCIEPGQMAYAQRIDCIKDTEVTAGSYVVKCLTDLESNSNSIIMSSTTNVLKFITTILLLCFFIIF